MQVQESLEARAFRGCSIVLPLLTILDNGRCLFACAEECMYDTVRPSICSSSGRSSELHTFCPDVHLSKSKFTATQLSIDGSIDAMLGRSIQDPGAKQATCLQLDVQGSAGGCMANS